MKQRYFVIPFEQTANLPSTCTVWYATWTQEPPARVPPGAPAPMVVGVTTDDRLPARAISILDGDKDPLPPPPPPPPSNLTAYRRSFQSWLSIARSEDE